MSKFKPGQKCLYHPDKARVKTLCHKDMGGICTVTAYGGRERKLSSSSDERISWYRIKGLNHTFSVWEDELELLESDDV